MFSIHVAAPPFASAASVHYRCLHNLRRAQRGVKCTTNHDMGHSTDFEPSIVNGKVTEKGSGTVTHEECFEVDDLVYKECFVVRRSEIGINNTATIEAIARLSQETSCNRLRSFGWSKDVFPTSPAMRKHRLVWITSGVHIRMYKYPARNLVMMNQDTRKVQKMSSDVWDEYLALCTKSPRLALFPEKKNRCLWKIPILNEPVDYYQLGLTPRIVDLHVNRHVNNVTYYSWLLQSIPQDIVEMHELEAITINYRHECQYNDTINSLASTELEVESINPFHDKSALSNLILNSKGLHQFLHLLKFSGTDQETIRGRTVWRKMDK